ncbi:unnamed protein product [Protopolystoma xenopodis]|uniref:Uncharacterized protein n=1 Tax=Protopolystoma xenopodis TaxID=117903 RepID=A0A3S5AK05_9PLAT|nr:unnamed protein product [Protopolystoma xenopodis]
MLWCTENLQFLGIQRSVSHRAVAPLPTNINWIDWNWFGGEFVMASPTPRSLNSDEVACAVENAMLAQLNIEKSRLQEKFIFTEEKQQ